MLQRHADGLREFANIVKRSPRICTMAGNPANLPPFFAYDLTPEVGAQATELITAKSSG